MYWLKIIFRKFSQIIPKLVFFVSVFHRLCRIIIASITVWFQWICAMWWSIYFSEASFEVSERIQSSAHRTSIYTSVAVYVNRIQGECRDYGENQYVRFYNYEITNNQIFQHLFELLCSGSGSILHSWTFTNKMFGLLWISVNNIQCVHVMCNLFGTYWKSHIIKLCHGCCVWRESIVSSTR